MIIMGDRQVMLKTWLKIFGWLVFILLVPFYFSFTFRCISGDSDIGFLVGVLMICIAGATGGVFLFKVLSKLQEYLDD